MIRVLYNALHLTGQFSGVQHTEEELMQTAFLHPFLDISFAAVCPATYRPRFQVSSPNSLVYADIDSSQRWQRIAYEHFLLERDSEVLLHCPAYILPWCSTGKSVVTVHDTIALDYPAYCTLANRFYFRWALPRSIDRADRIIAVSETVKKDIIRRFPFAADKTGVVYHGISSCYREELADTELERVKEKYHLPDEFILFVGNVEPKKNLLRLLKAYDRLCRCSDRKHSLVVAGQLGWKYADVLQWMKHKVADRICFLGYIEATDLPALYRLAALFVFPSLYEGFGLPPLEAMTCGVPTIVSMAGALPEITGGCAYQIDPLSVESIARGMDEILQDIGLRNWLRREGRQRAAQFTWEKTWTDTAAIYRNVETG